MEHPHQLRDDDAAWLLLELAYLEGEGWYSDEQRAVLRAVADAWDELPATWRRWIEDALRYAVRMA